MRHESTLSQESPGRRHASREVAWPKCCCFDVSSGQQKRRRKVDVARFDVSSEPEAIKVAETASDPFAQPEQAAGDFHNSSSQSGLHINQMKTSHAARAGGMRSRQK